MDDIIIVANFDDANFILNNYSNSQYILTLTPDLYNYLQNKNLKLIDVFKINYDKIHSETIQKTFIIDKLIEKKLTDINLRLSTKEYIKFQINVFMSSFIFLLTFIKTYKQITIIDGNKYRKINNINDELEMIFNKMLKLRGFSYYFPTQNSYKKASNYLIKLNNNILKYFFYKKNIIFSSGEEYGMNILNNKLLKFNNNSRIIKLESLDSKYYVKIIINLLKLIFLKKKFSLFPINEYQKNYFNVINSIFLDLQNNELKSAKNSMIPILVEGVNYIENTNNYFSSYFSKININFFFAHQIKMSNSLILGEIAKLKNAKIFLISHGIHSCSKDTNTHIALSANARGMIVSSLANFSIIQSKISKKAFDVYNTKNISINSLPLMWGNKDIKKDNYNFIDRQRKVILHASTFKSFNVRPWIYESTFEYINGLNKLISKIRNLKDVTLIIRLRPTSECSYETLENLISKSSNVVLKKDGDFMDDLKKASLLISYSSTTIEEALYERVPVAIYANSIRFNHFECISEDINSKRSAVYNLSDQNMEKELKKIIKDHFNKPLTDDELKNYIWTKEDLELTSYNKLDSF